MTPEVRVMGPPSAAGAIRAALFGLEVAVTVVPDGVTGSFAAWPSGRDVPASRPVPRNEEESA